MAPRVGGGVAGRVPGGADCFDATSDRARWARLAGTLGRAGWPISPGVVAELAAIAPVSRVGGNVFNRGAIIYSQLPAGQFNVVLVTGLNFPDGLTAAAFAGAEARALTYLVPGNCVPPVVASEITRLNPPTITIIGGSAAVTPAIESLTPC